MARHVSDREMMQLLDSGGGPARDHVGACPACRLRLEDAREGLRAAQEAEVPEPSPLYWEAFRRQVGRRISEEPRGFERWRLAPAFALAAAVALAVFPQRLAGPAHPTPAGMLPAWSALPPSDEDDGLAVLQVAVSLSEPGAVEGCHGVADCVVDLSDEESRALADVLRNEIGRPL